MVFRIQPIHQRAVDQDDQYEADDAPLLREPKAQGVAGAGKVHQVQPVREQDAAAQADKQPDHGENRHQSHISDPVAFQRGADPILLRTRVRMSPLIIQALVSLAVSRARDEKREPHRGGLVAAN